MSQFETERLEKAAKGKSYSSGGYNIGDIEEYLLSKGLNRAAFKGLKRSGYNALLLQYLGDQGEEVKVEVKTTRAVSPRRSPRRRSRERKTPLQGKGRGDGPRYGYMSKKQYNKTFKWKKHGDFGWDGGMVMISDIAGIYRFIADKKKENPNYLLDHDDLIWGPQDWKYQDWKQYLANKYNVVLLDRWGGDGGTYLLAYTNGIDTKEMKLPYYSVDPDTIDILTYIPKDGTPLEKEFSIKWEAGALFFGDPGEIVDSFRGKVTEIEKYGSAHEFLRNYPKSGAVHQIYDVLPSKGKFDVVISYEDQNKQIYQQIVLK